MTSFCASSRETFPLASVIATLMKSFQVLMGVEIWLLSTIHPTVPQSLHTECLLPGSHGWFVNTVSRFLKFGIFERSNSCSKLFATICGMYGPVGTTMSYPLLPAAATNFVTASSFDAYVSIEVVGPSSWVNLLKSFGSSYAAQWRKFSLFSRTGDPADVDPPAAGEAPPLLLPHADSKMPPETAATTDPPMNARRLMRWAAPTEARIFKPSSDSLISPSCFSWRPHALSDDRGRFVARRIGEHDLGLLRPEHMGVIRLPRAPHSPTDVQMRSVRAREPGDDLLATGCEHDELDHVAEMRAARQFARDRVPSIRRLPGGHPHGLRPDGGERSVPVHGADRLERRTEGPSIPP